MAPGKRRGLHQTGPGGSPGGSFKSSRMNFRPNSGVQEDRGGTRPTTTPSSISLVLITMLLHLCKKSLLFDARLKVGLYLGAIFIVSLIADFVTMPKSYFSVSDNILNRLFVKWSWAWLLSVTIPWILLTAHTIGCGKKQIIIKHIARIILATLAWNFWIRAFNYIETNYGRCNTKDFNLQSKSKCIQAGFFWSGFDVSGHTFILIYSSLILAEEGSSFVGWEGIKDFILREEHSRSLQQVSSSPLRNLADTELDILKKAHKTLTPYLRGLFVVMTAQQVLWDVMLISTMLYYHIMAEKFIGGVVAVGTWYVTYHWLYKLSIFGINSPGDGLFEYNKIRKNNNNGGGAAGKARRSTLNGSTPTFMGMPIRIQDNGDNGGRVESDLTPR